MIEVRKPSRREIDEMQSLPIWEKGPSTFDWEYTEPERCLIIEGKATVTSDDENIEFGEGDLVTFPQGLKCTWKIKEKIRKHYVFG